MCTLHIDKNRRKTQNFPAVVIYVSYIHQEECYKPFLSPSISSLCGRSNHREERPREKRLEVVHLRYPTGVAFQICPQERRRPPRWDLTSPDEYINVTALGLLVFLLCVIEPCICYSSWVLNSDRRNQQSRLYTVKTRSSWTLCYSGVVQMVLRQNVA